MNPFTMNPADLVGLDAVVITEKLKTRRTRSPDHAAESRAVVALTERMASAPQSILQTLADVTVELCPSQSAGLSLLTQDRKRFYWAAISGRWADHKEGGALGDFGPCDTVLHCNATQLMWRPERHFTYFAGVRPAIEELLLVPLHVRGQAVGAIWAIVHDQSRRFDSEVSRLLNILSKLAATAYQVVLASPHSAHI
jgi:transcriptional regulator with GAF, ATPase, and Fis domain